jgi:hypothetical protein
MRRGIVVASEYFFLHLHIDFGESSAMMTILSKSYLTSTHSLTRQHTTSMAQLCTQAISDLATAQTRHDRISALKHIKNALVGHQTNKEAFVRHGLVDILAQILSTSSGGDEATPQDSFDPEDEEGVLYQALILLRSLVKGWDCGLVGKKHTDQS